VRLLTILVVTAVALRIAELQERLAATPERASDGAQLAAQVLRAMRDGEPTNRAASEP